MAELLLPQAGKRLESVAAKHRYNPVRFQEGRKGRRRRRQSDLLRNFVRRQCFYLAVEQFFVFGFVDFAVPGRDGKNNTALCCKGQGLAIYACSTPSAAAISIMSVSRPNCCRYFRALSILIFLHKTKAPFPGLLFSRYIQIPFSGLGQTFL